MKPIRWIAGSVAAASLLLAIKVEGAPKPKPPVRAVYIAIVSVDATTMTITVEPKNSVSTETKTYKLTPATTVKVNGNPAAFADLKPDMQIHFELSADGTTATELSAARPPAGSE